MNEIGDWTWTSKSQDDAGLDGKTGHFTALKSDLPGMLKPAENNPRRWVMDDGQGFLNISDTAYRLFNSQEGLWQDYVRDDSEMGITSVRAGSLGGYAWEADAKSSQYPWDGDDMTRYDLAKFQTTDSRLKWMLNNYPDMYVQMIIFGQIDWQTDEVGTTWAAMPEAVRENTMRYMIARWGAFPQIFWLGVNDLNCSENPQQPHLWARSWAILATNDPWHHLISVSPTRKMTFCYLGEEDADWVSYIHLQDGHALGAELIKQYAEYPLHVFLGEDYYEQDHETRYPRHPAYFQRWLFWSWLLSGGSANYGGRYPVIDPYKQSAELPFNFNGRDYPGLTGLDSVPYINSYFKDRQIDLTFFEPDDSLVSDGDGRNDTRRPELMRRGDDEFIIYHPNAKEIERFADVDPAITPVVVIDLSDIPGVFSVEWYRPSDGGSQLGADIIGNDVRELTAPWQGSDVVLRLVRQSEVMPTFTPTAQLTFTPTAPPPLHATAEADSNSMFTPAAGTENGN